MARVFFILMSAMMAMAVYASFTGAWLEVPKVDRSIRGGSMPRVQTRTTYSRSSRRYGRTYSRTHSYYRGK